MFPWEVWITKNYKEFVKISKNLWWKSLSLENSDRHLCKMFAYQRHSFRHMETSRGTAQQ